MDEVVSAVRLLRASGQDDHVENICENICNDLLTVPILECKLKYSTAVGLRSCGKCSDFSDEDDGQRSGGSAKSKR